MRTVVTFLVAFAPTLLQAEKPSAENSKALNAATALFAKGKYDDAEKGYRALLTKLDKSLNKEHPAIWADGIELGNKLLGQGKFNEAENSYRALLTIQQHILGAEHADTLTIRHNLTFALVSQDKYVEAEQEQRLVLALRERLLGEQHVDVFESCYSLAQCLSEQKKFKDALAFIQRAETGWKKALGPSNESTKRAEKIRKLIESHLADENTAQAMQTGNLGAADKQAAVALYQKGNYAEAERAFRAIVASEGKSLGAEHSDTLVSRMNLAAALRIQGKHAESEREYRTVLAIRERISGAEHADTLKAKVGVASALFSQDKVIEAEREYRAVVATLEHVLGDAHANTLQTRSDLANAMWIHGMKDEAENEMRAIIAIQEREPGDHPKVYRSYAQLAIRLEDQGKLKEALELMLRAEKGYKKALGPEDTNSKNAQKLREKIETKLKQQK